MIDNILKDIVKSAILEALQELGIGTSLKKDSIITPEMQPEKKPKKEAVKKKEAVRKSKAPIEQIEQIEQIEEKTEEKTEEKAEGINSDTDTAPLRDYTAIIREYAMDNKSNKEVIDRINRVKTRHDLPKIFSSEFNNNIKNIKSIAEEMGAL